jgi:DNA-binding PadR family transcriptional regulator
MAKDNTTAYIILGLLVHESSSGYDLKKKIDRMISMFWDVGYGQLYPTLKALEKEGYILSTAEKSSKGPDRYIYEITASGRQKLSDWLTQAASKEYIRYEILLKLFFGNQLSPSENIKKIEAFKKLHEKDLELIKLYKHNLKEYFYSSPDHLYYYLTVLFGEYIYKAYLDWSDTAINFINERLAKGVSNEASENT